MELLKERRSQVGKIFEIFMIESTPKMGKKTKNLTKAWYISNLNCHYLKVVAIDKQIVTGL